jgi:hypothetical protein
MPDINNLRRKDLSWLLVSSQSMVAVYRALHEHYVSEIMERRRLFTWNEQEAERKEGFGNPVSPSTNASSYPVPPTRPHLLKFLESPKTVSSFPYRSL